MPSPTPSPADKASATLALVITLAIQALASAAVNGPTSIAPLLLQSMALPTSAVGIYITIVYIGAVLSSLVSGAWMTRIGAIRVSQISLGLCAMGSLLILTGSLWLAPAGALLMGMGYGPITPASSQILARTTPAERMGLVFSIKQTGVPLGGVLVGLVMPSLALSIGWPGALAALVVACLACALVAQPLRASLDAGSGRSASRQARPALMAPVRAVWNEPVLRMMALCSLVFSATQVSLTAYLVSWLSNGLAWPLVAAGAALSFSQAAGASGRIVWGWLADRGLGAPRTLLLLCGLMIAGTITIPLLGRDTPHGWVIALLVVYGATAIGWNGVFLATVARAVPPERAGAITGGTMVFTYCGVMVGPAVFGAIAAGYSFGTAFATLSLPLTGCLLALWRWQRAAQHH